MATLFYLSGICFFTFSIYITVRVYDSKYFQKLYFCLDIISHKCVNSRIDHQVNMSEDMEDEILMIINRLEALTRLLVEAAPKKELPQKPVTIINEPEINKW